MRKMWIVIPEEDILYDGDIIFAENGLVAIKIHQNSPFIGFSPGYLRQCGYIKQAWQAKRIAPIKQIGNPIFSKPLPLP